MIREASLSDAKAISDLISSTAQEHIVPTLAETGARQLLSLMDESAMRSFFQDGFQFYVAESEGVLLGVTAIRPPSHLYSLFVRTDVHHKGTGRLLWLHARDWILHHHHSEEITVNSSLNAVPFYQKLGFRNAGDPVQHLDVRYQPMILRIDCRC